jgi:hypothetical protein
MMNKHGHSVEHRHKEQEITRAGFTSPARAAKLTAKSRYPHGRPG